MSLAYSPITPEEIFNSSFPPSSDAKFLCLDMEGGLTLDLFGHPDWRCPGASLIANTSVSPTNASACSLSDIEEKEVPRKYFLSVRACRGILQRSEREGVKLPEQLKAALITGAGSKRLSSTSQEYLHSETEGRTSEPKHQVISLPLRKTGAAKSEHRKKSHHSPRAEASPDKATPLLLPRRLVPKECERALGFRDNWTLLTVLDIKPSGTP